MKKAIRGRDEWALARAVFKASPVLAVSWWAVIILRGALPGLFAVAVGALVAAVQRGGQVSVVLVGVGALFVLMQAIAPVQTQVGANLGDRLTASLNDELLQATTGPAGLAHLESPELTDDLTMARDFELGQTGPPMSLAMGFIAGGLALLVAGVGQLVVLAAYRWWAPLLVGGAWGATHWLLRRSTAWDRTTGEVREAQRVAEYSYRLAMDVPAAKEVRLFGLTDWIVTRFRDARRHLVEVRWRDTRIRPGQLVAAIGLLLVANAAFFVALARDAAAGAVGLGAVVTFAQAGIGASALAFGGLNWALPHAAAGAAAVSRLRPAMVEAGRLPDGDRPATGMPATGIRLRNVGFAYASDGRPVLDGLDLFIPAGSSIAVVGANGAGKTTLMKLLCRLYDPTEGAVEVDGVDLRELDLTSWRGRITAIFQDYIRYELPLRDNVAPVGDADDPAVRDALGRAGADGIAGLDTVLAAGYDGGVDLSGGQWQRVALARLLKAVGDGAGLVILDEPTAQLDVRGEAEIFEHLLASTRGCTTVLISHRFSTVRHADLICVLDDGRVAELGDHDTLMAAGGRYRTMFDLQASRFESVGEESDERVHS
ncbi:ABC transporter ATP-binding protein [Micromonospora sp. HUAS YX12]|uniref:ABC transporter ATP-binding protein n=1 Tax=Micromonospora sp. HUAS YX12 TaxID=3156396 RepID=A0AAU7R3U4_9ACTN